MSSVLHPVGPEPEQTYWARRLAVLISLVVVVGVVAALIVSSLSTGSAVSAAPAPSPATQEPATGVSPSASASPSAAATPSPSASPSVAARSGATASASPSTAAKPKAKAQASQARSRKPVPAAPVACAPSKLRATLTGKQTLKPKQDNRFTLSLINGSAATCKLSVTPKNFELKIYSGTDRIWSSSDCSTAVKPISRKIKAEAAVEWTMTWDGNRSRKNCKDRPEVPRPGTYFATAQLDGAKPVQLRMILRG